MTNKELKCLEFLNNKMEATAAMIGEFLLKEFNPQVYDWYYKEHVDTKQSSLRGAATTTLGKLHKNNYIMRIPELKAWRITQKGREALAEAVGVLEVVKHQLIQE